VVRISGGGVQRHRTCCAAATLRYQLGRGAPAGSLVLRVMYASQPFSQSACLPVCQLASHPVQLSASQPASPPASQSHLTCVVHDHSVCPLQVQPHPTRTDAEQEHKYAASCTARHDTAQQGAEEVSS
jgi:hypothetical protein